MKIENLKMANNIAKRIDHNEKALENIHKILEKYCLGNAVGWEVSDPQKLYDLVICEYDDGSGFKIDLAGSNVQIETLKYVGGLLRNQIKADRELMESF